MKQKIVIEVSINDKKSRKRALTVAVGQSGVISAALEGEDKNKIQVIGEGVDAVELTTMLRKKVGFAALLNVSAVSDGKKGDDKKPTENKNEVVTPQPAPQWPCYSGVPFCPIYYEVKSPVHYYDDPSCTIM